jgi:hypothetical protein
MFPPLVTRLPSMGLKAILVAEVLVMPTHVTLALSVDEPNVGLPVDEFNAIGHAHVG